MAIVNGPGLPDPPAGQEKVCQGFWGEEAAGRMLLVARTLQNPSHLRHRPPRDQMREKLDREEMI